VETGDKVWVRMRARGTEVRSGKSVDFYVFDICRFKDGRLVEHWGVPLRYCIKQERCPYRSRDETEKRVFPPPWCGGRGYTIPCTLPTA
jgi:predicted SnoaL-like aldol condensation-catalyzing enzyme